MPHLPYDARPIERSLCPGIENYIRERIAAGDTKDEIKARLVAQFGPSILAGPPKHGFGLLAWWLPIGGALSASAILGLAVYRWSRGRALPLTESAAEALDPELERRLDHELARFE